MVINFKYCPHRSMISFHKISFSNIRIGVGQDALNRASTASGLASTLRTDNETFLPLLA